jgi:alkylation response protein AidB-like acyl-CoA dehydrogenase
MVADAHINLTPTVLSDDERRLRADVRAFLDAELPIEHRTALGQSGGWDPEFSQRLAARGWVGMAIPRAYGGRGAGAVQRFVVTEELLAAQAPLSAHWIADRQTAPSILRFGTEAQKRRFLPAIARAECFFAIGMSEPDAGSDLASVRTRARAVDGGWTVSGTKVWTTGADRAGHFVVLCRTADVDDNARHDGLSQLIVDLRGDGVTVNPIRTMEGDAEFCEVVLEDVFVSDELVLGTIGDGWRQVTSELSHERYGPERWLSTWGAYAACSEALGQDANAADEEQLGRLAAQLRIVRQMSFAVARAIDEGGRPAVEAAIVKDLGTRLEQQIAEAVRALLARELDPGSPVRADRMAAAAVLAAPVLTIRGGTTEILRSIVSRGVRA